MAIEKIIGKQIREYRKARKITQEDLATSASLDRGYLSEIENGHKNFSIQTLEKIARALKIPIKDLIKDIDNSHT